jgi:hypothetical protein
MFVTLRHLHPSLVFVSKGKSLPIEWSPVSDLIWVGSSLTFKYLTRAELTESDKHSSLVRYRIIFGRKRFTVEAREALLREKAQYH